MARKVGMASSVHNPDDRMMWGLLLHLGYNMWCDREVAEWGVEHITAQPYLRCDRGLWEELTARAAAAGLNTLVIDLGEGVRYESHPELAVEGAWSCDELHAELARLRGLGLEAIPKLNFSATHDVWLGEYSRCVSTPRYYEVCRDLIQEVADLFSGPRLFHLGMDEESWHHQRHYAYVVVRQHELWWRDLLYLVEQVERQGAQAWVWADYAWNHEEYYERMPRTVLQSNWYYGTEFHPPCNETATYQRLAEAGYCQVPTGSNWITPENMRLTVSFCRDSLPLENLRGFLMTAWKPTLPSERACHEQAIDLIAEAKALWEG